MAIALKTRPVARDDAARAKLASLHAECAEAAAAVQQAVEAHDAAVHEYRTARSAVLEIEDRIADLNSQRHYGMWQLRAERDEKTAEAEVALKDARLKLMPLDLAQEATQARLTQAQQRLSLVQLRLHQAAEDVVRAEVEAPAQAMLERVNEALRLLLSVGPDLYLLAESGLLPSSLRQAVDAAGGNVLNRSVSGWSEFGNRYRASPWRSIVAVLEGQGQHDTSLPPVTSV